jgi:hypothetical protein
MANYLVFVDRNKGVSESARLAEKSDYIGLCRLAERRYV